MTRDERFRNPLAYHKGAHEFWRFMAITAHVVWIAAACSFVGSAWAGQ